MLQQKRPLSTLHTPLLCSLLQGSALLCLRFRVTRLLQRSDTFGSDGLTHLFLFGAHDMGLLERGL